MTPFFLIADDSAAKRAFLQSILKHVHWDGEVLTAATTEEALRLIVEHPDIAAAFIDYFIPLQNGPAVIRTLRAANARAKIALVTATDSQHNEEEARRAGADAFVCTSWPEPDVIQRLTDLLAVWQEAPR